MLPSIGHDRPNGKRDARRVDSGANRRARRALHRSNADQFRIVVPVLDEAAALPALLAELQRPRSAPPSRSSSTTARPTTGPAQIERPAPCCCASPGAATATRVFRGLARRSTTAPGSWSSWRPTAPTTPPRRGCWPSPCSAGAADLVIGSRRAAVRGRQGGMPLHQRLGNDWLALALRMPVRSASERRRTVPGGRAARSSSASRSRSAPTPSPPRWPSRRDCWARASWWSTRRYRRRRGRSKIAGTWRGSLLAVRDITWCLCRLRLFGFRTAELAATAGPRLVALAGGAARPRRPATARWAARRRSNPAAPEASTPAAAGVAAAAPGSASRPSVRPDCDTATTRQIAASAMYVPGQSVVPDVATSRLS